MRVLFVSPLFWPSLGGAQRFQQEMARRCREDGHESVVLTTAARGSADFWEPAAPEVLLPAVEAVQGVEVHRMGIAYPRPAPYAFGLYRRAGHWLARSPLPPALQRPIQARLARWMPPLPGLPAALERWAPWADVVQAVDSSWDGLFTGTAHAAARYGRPFVAVPLMHLGGAAVRAHFTMVHQVNAYRGAAAVVALSGIEARAYQALGVANEKVHVVAMGADPPQPAPDPAPVAALRGECGAGGPLVAFLGANTYDKGAFTLALAVAELNRSGFTVDLTCAGPGGEQLAAFVKRQPPEIPSILASRLHVLGTVNEDTKQALLAACDVLALPSRVDTFGIVFLEAWLHGKPVIGANAGGIPDLVADDANGLLVPFGDVPALAGALRRVLAEPGLGARLGRAGCETARQRYSWARTYEAMQGIYERAYKSGLPFRR